MKRNPLWLASLPVAALIVASPAWAQEPRITFPAEGQDVRGEINIRWEGIPDGGYGVVYIDPETTEGKAPLTASAEGSFPLNTFLDTVNKVRLGDGPHKLRVVAVNGQGKRTGQSEVSFNIANAKVDPLAPPARLAHWSDADRIANRVKRYRVYAISNAVVEEPEAAGGGGGESGSSGGRGGSSSGGASGSGDSGAALDFQISALVRRIVRDVGMVDGSANIRAVVDRAYEKTREGASGGEGGSSGGSSSGSRSGGRSGGRGSSSGSTAPGEKPPWGEWMPARETGQYYVKMIKPTGEEINATRKAPSIALGDLLPSFPQGDVRPGSTWETQMTMISELAERSPLNVRNAPMTFTAFEEVTTPGGFKRRCAKLESRFQLPAAQAKEEATKLASKLGTSGAGGGEGGVSSSGSSSGGRGSSSGGEGGAAAEPPEVKNARVRVSRVLWFDIAGRQVLRSEDVVDTNFEMESATAGGGEAGGRVSSSGGRGSSSSSGGRGYAGSSGGRGGYGAGGGYGSAGGYPGAGGRGGYGGEGAAADVPAEPTKVAYNQRITTWLDDSVPPPTEQFNGGAGTAHSRDSVPDLSIDRVNTPDAPIDVR